VHWQCASYARTIGLARFASGSCHLPEEALSSNSAALSLSIGSNRDVSTAAQRCEPPFQCSAPDGQVRPVIFKYWTLVRWHPSGLPPWQRRLPAALAARASRRVRPHEPLQLGATPLARTELVGWPAAWRPKIAAPLTFALACLVFHTVYSSCHRPRMSAYQRRRSGLERLPRGIPAGMAPDGHPRAKTRRAGNTTSRTTVSQPRARSPGFALLIPLGPCDDREEKRATYGHDMNDDYLIGRRCRVPGFLD
jgi:hypothetical protein